MAQITAQGWKKPTKEQVEKTAEIELPFTPTTLHIIVEAQELAKAAGANRIDSYHLLKAMIDHDRSAAQKILVGFDIESADITPPRRRRAQ